MLIIWLFNVIIRLEFLEAKRMKPEIILIMQESRQGLKSEKHIGRS